MYLIGGEMGRYTTLIFAVTYSRYKENTQYEIIIVKYTWNGQGKKEKDVIINTHSIEESVFMGACLVNDVKNNTLFTRVIRFKLRDF